MKPGLPLLASALFLCLTTPALAATHYVNLT